MIQGVDKQRSMEGLLVTEGAGSPNEAKVGGESLLPGKYRSGIRSWIVGNDER